LAISVIVGARHADADAEIHFPFRQVDTRKNLVLLLRDGIEVCRRPNEP